MYQTLDDLEKNQDSQIKPSKRKKRVKWIFIILGLIVGFGLLRYLSMIAMIRPTLIFKEGQVIIILIISVLISLFVEILIVYLIILRRTRKFGGNDKIKRRLKVSLIILSPFLFLSAFTFFTIAGNIPNWFSIEILENYYCGPKKKYNWEDDKCYQKCNDGCTYEGCAIMGWSCSEECDMMCEVPKYENCISKCKKPKIEGYDKEHYDLRYKQQHSEKAFRLGDREIRYMKSYYGDYDIVLMEKEGYNKWINEKFSGYIEELNEYELCLSTCGSAPGYIPYDKPIIYLYPTTETQVNVKLGIPETLSHTYPKYDSEKGWNVIAQPNGNLKDVDTGRKLYALYREGKSKNETNFDEGFVVAGKDIIPFLEEKLAILGLNEREAEEFIIYRLPQMEDNAYNLIRFETKAEQDENMPLNITPKPDIVIRIMMDWKAIDEPIDIPEQELVAPERTGFTVVERGGSPRN